MAFNQGGHMQNKSEPIVVNKPKKGFWLEHVKQWESSNLSQQAYSTQEGITYGTFVYWRGQFLLESGHSKARQFLPVEVKQQHSDTPQSVKIKLITGNIVCIPTSVGIPEIAKLIRLLECSNA
jgi:hypothetical protein